MIFLKKVSLLILFNLIWLPSFAFATPVDEKIIEQNEILQSIQIQQTELDNLSNQYTEALLAQEELENQITTTTNEIESLDVQIKDNQKQLGEQCNYMYKNGNISFIEVILNSTDYNSFLTNWDYYNRFANQTSILVDETKQLRVKMNDKKIAQEEEKENLKETILELERTQEKANGIMSNLQNQYAQLDDEIANLIIQEQLNSSENYNIENAASVLTNSTVGSTEEFQNIVAEIQAQDAAAGITSDYNDVVSRAYSMLGASYAWGGTTSAGFDCSGFVSYCLTGQEGTRLGTTETFSNWTQVSDPQPGDVCVIHNGESQHTGIYVGDGNMVHASTYGVGVIESPVQEGMIYVRYE